MAHLAILKLSESWRNLKVYHYMQKDNENIKI